jgi:hypothetical protein
MSMEQLGVLLSSVFGFAINMCVGFVAMWCGDQINVDFFFRSDGADDSAPTFYGYMAGFLGMSIGLWAGMAVYNKSFTAGCGEKYRWSYLAWVLGFLIMAIFAAISDLAFQRFSGTGSSILRFIINFSATAVVGWSVYQGWKYWTAGLKDD